MALTAEQKASNKAAQRVRDRAHKERLKRLRESERCAENHPDVLAAKAAFDEANAALDAYLRERDETIRQLRQQIAELESKINVLNREGGAEIRQCRRDAAGLWRSLLDSKMQAAQSLFPDLNGPAQFSAADWQPPTEVLEQMEQAQLTAA